MSDIREDIKKIKQVLEKSSCCNNSSGDGNGGNNANLELLLNQLIAFYTAQSNISIMMLDIPINTQDTITNLITSVSSLNISFFKSLTIKNIGAVPILTIDGNYPQSQSTIQPNEVITFNAGDMGFIDINSIDYFTLQGANTMIKVLIEYK